MMVMLAGCPPVIGHFVPDDNGGGMTLWLTFNCYFHKNSLVRAFSDDSEQSLYSTKKKNSSMYIVCRGNQSQRAGNWVSM
jgi:hypothetical protein